MTIPFLADCFFTLSLVGIWPRYIEPNMLTVNKIRKSIPSLSPLRIVQFSDLHLHRKVPNKFLDRLSKRIRSLAPDLLVFTGDFICRGRLDDPKRLQAFLSSLSAPLGCFAILGNHDYDAYVSRNAEGDYDIVRKERHILINSAIQLFKNKKKGKPNVTEAAKNASLHFPLLDLLKKTPFRFLHNETIQPDPRFNLCGLGDYWLGRTLPELAFKNYDPDLPGIILAHNPDSIATFENYPGDLVLSGHTHGGQINLPFIGDRLIKLEDPRLKHGLKHLSNRSLYVNRGVGNPYPLRLFAPPELTVIEL